MKCLHICNDYFGSKVHRNLYAALSDLEFDHTVFYPSRRKVDKAFENAENSLPYKTIISGKMTLLHRVLFYPKIDFLYRELVSSLDPTEYSITHATTLYSDGALALRLKRKHGVPYIINIRATDIDLFTRFRIDLIPLGRQIISEAEKVVFISKALYTKYNNSRLNLKNGSIHDQKRIFIYNGIDKYWLNNLNFNESIKEPYKVLYIGNLVKRKNPLNLVKAVLKIAQENVDIKLTLIGKDEGELQSIQPFLNQHPDIFQYIDHVSDRNQLLNHFRNHHIFALPAITESFGLVYLEALSQGLPVLLIENEGIDGILHPFPGTPIPTPSVTDIAEGIKKTIENYPVYKLSQIDFSQFDWHNIALKYNLIYQGQE